MNKYETYNALRDPLTTFNELIGRVLIRAEVVNENEELRLYITDDNYVRFYHSQDCCESVYIEDICGDLNDLVGSPILVAEEVSNYEGPEPEYAESYTWTFYKFRTNKGSVDVRWLGESNGYYSESVNMEIVGGEIAE